jgi:hypothetical protein
MSQGYLRNVIDEALTEALSKHKGFCFDDSCELLMPLDLTQGINVDTLTEAVLSVLREACK